MTHGHMDVSVGSSWVPPDIERATCCRHRQWSSTLPRKTRAKANLVEDVNHAIYSGSYVVSLNILND